MCTVVEGEESPVGSGVGRVSIGSEELGEGLISTFDAWRGLRRLEADDGNQRGCRRCSRAPFNRFSWMLVSFECLAQYVGARLGTSERSKSLKAAALTEIAKERREIIKVERISYIECSWIVVVEVKVRKENIDKYSPIIR